MMKKTELEKMVSNAKTELVKDYDDRRYMVELKELKREVMVPAASPKAARAAALELIENEPEHIRGFKLT